MINDPFYAHFHLIFFFSICFIAVVLNLQIVFTDEEYVDGYSQLESGVSFEFMTRIQKAVIIEIIEENIIE